MWRRCPVRGWVDGWMDRWDRGIDGKQKQMHASIEGLPERGIDSE